MKVERKCFLKGKRLALTVCAMSVILGSMLLAGSVTAWPPRRRWVIHVYPVLGGTPIQNAVNSVWAPAFTSIIVHQGAYYEEVTINASKSGLMLVGDGAVLDASQSLSFGISIVGADYVTIKGFKIRNYFVAGVAIGADPSTSNRATWNDVTNNTIENNCGDGICIDSSDNNRIYGNIIQANYWNGIFVNRGDGNMVRSNGIINNLCNGIRLQNVSLTPATPTAVVGNDVLTNHGNGLYAFNSNFSVISNNKFSGNWVSNVLLVFGNNNTVLANEATFSGYDGILLQGSDGTLVKSNDASNNPHDGICVMGFYFGGGIVDPAEWNWIRDNTALNCWYDLVWDGLGFGNSWRVPRFWGPIANNFTVSVPGNLP